MIGEVADVDPLTPRLAGLPHLVGGFFVGLRRRMLRPAQRDEHVVALGEAGPGPRFVTLEADAEVRRQPQGGMRLRILARAGDGLAVRGCRVLPRRRLAVIVEGGLAAHHQLDDAADASDGPQQDVLGVPVHRRAAVGPRAGVDVVPRAHHQRVAHDHPAGVGLPGGLEDQAARQIAPSRRHRHAVGARGGSARRRGPGSRRTRSVSPVAERTATRRPRPTRPGRCSRSRKGMRSRRSAGTGSATGRSAHTAPEGSTVNGVSGPAVRGGRRRLRCVPGPSRHHRPRRYPASTPWRIAAWPGVITTANAAVYEGFDVCAKGERSSIKVLDE